MQKEWEGLDTDVRDSRLETLKAKMQEWVAQNQADLKELNKVQSSPLPKRARSSKCFESASENEEEKSERQGEAEASPEPGAGAKAKAAGTSKKKRKEDDRKDMLGTAFNADLFSARFGPRAEAPEKKSSPSAPLLDAAWSMRLLFCLFCCLL